MPVPAITIDETGLHVPTYEDILTYVQDEMRAIYGADLYLEPDSQDGQFIGILSEALNNSFAAAVAVYNAYSPQTAQGTGLSNAVKINGMTRQSASYSTVEVTVSGDVGTLILNGLATDINNIQWRLPASVTIPGGGTIDVTAQCTTLGAIEALPNTITIIGTPTRGWFVVDNALAAVPGLPIETDAELRARQRTSVALPSQALLTGAIGAILALDSVTYAMAYENDTNVVDANTLPAHSVAFVIEGGLDADIAEAIFLKKTPGCYTYGTTTYAYVDPYGVTNTIRWFRPTDVPIKVRVSLTALALWSTAIQDKIAAALVLYLGAVQAGDDVILSRLYTPANLPPPDGDTYDITAIAIAKVPDAFGSANIVIAFNERASLALVNVTFVVT